MSAGAGDKSVELVVDGERLTAPAGASVAAALLRAGQVALRRSVRGGPRGPLCGMGICHECRARVDGRAHARTCMVVSREGMCVETRAAVSPAVIASRPSEEPARPDTVPERSDVAVVGAGPAGLAAALAAAESGAAVVVLDDNAEPGGQIWRRPRAGPPPRAASALRQRALRAGARLLGGTAVADGEAGEDGIRLLVTAGERAVEHRARAVVLATGARELWLPFPGWTLPGVVGAGGLQALVKQGLSVRGARVLVAGSGPLLVAVAATLRAHGARVLGLLEQAPLRASLAFLLAGGLAPRRWAQAAALAWRLRGTRLRHAAWVTRAVGQERLTAVEVQTSRGRRRVECDWLAYGLGLVPQLEVARLLGCDLAGEAVAVDGTQRTSVPGVWAAGEACGIGGLEAALAEGRVAGRDAAGGRVPRSWLRHRDRAVRLRRPLRRAYALRAELRGLAAPDTVVCRCEDVTAGQLTGYATAREAKLATRCGMGPCQGRVCGPATRVLFGWRADRVRPPLVPVPVAALAGVASIPNPNGGNA